MATLGQRVRERRKQLSMSQEELAHQVGTNQRQISYYELDKNDPTGHVLKALARALNTSNDWLLGLTDEMERPLDNDADLDVIEREIISEYRRGNRAEAARIILSE